MDEAITLSGHMCGIKRSKATMYQHMYLMDYQSMG